LPDYLQPTNYKLLIKSFFNPNSEPGNLEERFEGTAEISLRLMQNSNRIVFHMDSSLKLNGAITLRDQTQNVQINFASSNPLPNQLYELITSQSLLQTNEYLLTINYNGDYGPPSNLNGFYLSSYFEDGKTK
jgi:hypothetical protein